MRAALIAALLAAVGGQPHRAAAQSANISVSSPVQRVDDGFFERMGVDFGFRMGGPRGRVFFNQGGFDSALPPFGGYDPAAGANFGFGVQGRQGAFHARFAASEGCDRSIVSAAPQLTLLDGCAGWVADGLVRPFVTGFIPVVGSLGASPVVEKLQNLSQNVVRDLRSAAAAGSGDPRRASASPVVEKLPRLSGVSRRSAGDGGGAAADCRTPRPAANRPLARSNPRTSSAERRDMSVAEIRAGQAAEAEARRREVQTLIAHAQRLERAGKANVAKIYYQQAASRSADHARLTIGGEDLGKAPP